MAVLYRHWDSVGKQAVARLKAAGVPYQWVGRKSPLNTAEDSVKVITYHSSKGLEFPVVAIPRAEASDGRETDEKEEARLLYVAMTRAMERLVVGWLEGRLPSRCGASRFRVGQAMRVAFSG